jgi:hypothetical protein
MTPALTRRGLLQAGGAAGAAALVGAKPWAPATAEAAGRPSPLRRSSYTSLRSTAFSVSGIGVKLLSVSDLPAAATVKSLAGSEDAFSLVFSGPRSTTLAQGIHSFTNRDLGSFELFLVPIDIPADDQHYEVVVSTYRKPVVTKPSKRYTGRRARPHRAHGHKRPVVAIRRISVRRLRRGLAARFSLSKKAHVRQITVWLMRGDRLITAGSVGHLRGRDRAALKLRTKRRLRNGRYLLLVQTKDRHGVEVIKRRHVKLR